MTLPDKPVLAFIGVGLMGHGLVKNLLKEGHDVTLLDHPGNRPTDDLVRAGAKVGSTIADIVPGADVVFVCVTGTPEVEAVMLSKGGVLENLREGTIVVDCSTAIPESTLKLAEKVAVKGGTLVDAPMTRTPKEAEEGRLNVMLGGDDTALDAVIGLVACYAENIYRTGPVGSGHKMKLLHNYLALGNTVLAAEATACAEACGVDMNIFCDVIMTGGGDSLVFRRLQPYIQAGDEENFKFSIGNAEKDLGYYTAMAENLGMPKTAAEAVHAVLTGAKSEGLEAQSMPKLIDFMMQQKG